MGAPRTKNLGECSVELCDKPAVVRELCGKHYQRWRKYGDTSTVNTPFRGNALRGESHPRWGGKQIGYGSAHCRVTMLWGSASGYLCVVCGKAANNWSYDGTDPEQNYAQYRGRWLFYSPWPEFYMPMCGSCHHIRDKNIAAQELYEYRSWKHRTGKTLSEVTE